MGNEVWSKAMADAPTLASAAQVLHTFLGSPYHDHRLAIQLLAAFAARRATTVANDASVLAKQKSILAGCCDNLQAADQLMGAMGRRWID